jgi:hypothetical protein
VLRAVRMAPGRSSPVAVAYIVDRVENRRTPSGGHSEYLARSLVYSVRVLSEQISGAT